MIDRDALLQRVMRSNPHPNDQELPVDVADSRPPLALLIGTDATPKPPTRLHRGIRDTRMLAAPGAEDDAGWALGTPRSAGRRRGPGRTVVLAFAAVIVVLGAAAFVAGVLTDRGEDLIGADAVPTLTFDGETVTYDGPEAFDTGVITFRLDTTARDMIAFGWNVMNDESITLEEEIAWMETHRGPGYEIPPWVEDYGGIGTTTTAWTWEETVELPDGKLLLYVWSAGPRILYPAAHIYIDTG